MGSGFKNAECPCGKSVVITIDRLSEQVAARLGEKQLHSLPLYPMWSSRFSVMNKGKARQAGRQQEEISLTSSCSKICYRGGFFYFFFVFFMSLLLLCVSCGHWHLLLGCIPENVRCFCSSLLQILVNSLKLVFPLVMQWMLWVKSQQQWATP